MVTYSLWHASSQRHISLLLGVTVRRSAIIVPDKEQFHTSQRWNWTWCPTGNNNITGRVLGLDDGRRLNASNWGPNIIPAAQRHRRCEEGSFALSPPYTPTADLDSHVRLMVTYPCGIPQVKGIHLYTAWGHHPTLGNHRTR